MTPEKELLFLFNKEDHLTLFDIGSCDATQAIIYTKLFPNAKLFVFEPVPSNFQKIQKRIAAGNYSKIQAYEEALSDSVGESQMFVSSSEENKEMVAEQSSSLLPPDKHLEIYPLRHFDKRIIVKTNTIENFCSQQHLSKINFAHIDVQGAELMVLKGASDFINKIDALWLEVEHISLYKNQPLRKDIEMFMTRNGFLLIKFRVGGHSGDQLYVSKKILKIKAGKAKYFWLEVKAYLLRTSIYTNGSKMKRMILKRI